MALTDFYVSNENAYMNSCPIDSTNTDTIASNSWQVFSDSNYTAGEIYWVRFANYTPKIVSEQVCTKLIYGKPYLKAFDMQTLQSMIHGGYFYDVQTKNLYIKCFSVRNPITNNIKINVASAQSIITRTNSYYIHRTMRLGSNSGVRFEATVGLSDYYVASNNVISKQGDFQFSCILTDPDPLGDTSVSFPTLQPLLLNGIKFPGTTVNYFINEVVSYISELQSLEVSQYSTGMVRYCMVTYGDSTVNSANIKNWLFRYDPTAVTGDVKPNTSNGTGVGDGNGWWKRVYGEYVEYVINEVDDIAALAALPITPTLTGVYLYRNHSLRKVKSNGEVYKYVANANSGAVQPNTSNGTGVGSEWNGWWQVVPSIELETYGFINRAQHCGVTLKLNTSNDLVLTAEAVQQEQFAQSGGFSRTLEELHYGGFKMILELYPRIGVEQVLDYNLRISQIENVATNNILAPVIYTGTINGLPTNGNFSGFLVGFSAGEGVAVDDLTVSEIIESLI